MNGTHDTEITIVLLTAMSLAFASLAAVIWLYRVRPATDSRDSFHVGRDDANEAWTDAAERGYPMLLNGRRFRVTEERDP